MSLNHLTRRVLPLALLGLMASCGGGGSASNDTPNPDPNDPNDPPIVDPNDPDPDTRRSDWDELVWDTDLWS